MQMFFEICARSSNEMNCQTRDDDLSLGYDIPVVNVISD